MYRCRRKLDNIILYSTSGTWHVHTLTFSVYDKIIIILSSKMKHVGVFPKSLESRGFWHEIEILFPLNYDLIFSYYFLFWTLTKKKRTKFYWLILFSKILYNLKSFLMSQNYWMKEPNVSLLTVDIILSNEKWKGQ